MKKIVIISLIMFMSAAGNSQYLNVKINPGSKLFYGEEYIRISPKNPNQIVAGIMANYSPLTTIMGYCYSSDGGLTWESGPITCSFAQPGSDPVIAVDTNGVFYYICCGNWQVQGPNLDQLLCFKSTNGGANWDGGVGFAFNAPRLDDMPMACIDRSRNSAFGNYIYVTMSLYDSFPSNNPNDSCRVGICRSTNGGVSFDSTVIISKTAGTARIDNSSPEGVSPFTGPNGEVYAVWPLNEKVYFNRSTNAAVSWMNSDVYVSDQVGGWINNNWSPVGVCDISNSIYRGTLYVVFADKRNGANDRDIWLVKSTNRGTTWSSPKRVNNDGAGFDQQLPWITVDDVTGYVWIVFYDSRNAAQTISYPYVARSTDGGNTFANAKISNTYCYNFYWLGDYISIDAFNNRVRPLWTRPVGGFMASEIYTAIIDSFTIGVQNVTSEVPSSFVLQQNYPNPYNSSTMIRWGIPEQVKVRIRIFDMLGRERAEVVNEMLDAGEYAVRYDGEGLSSGVYFCVMECGRFKETRRMTVLK